MSFSSLNKVQVKGIVPIASLKFGEEVSVQDRTSNLYRYGLYDKKRRTMFRQIGLDNMVEPLEILAEQMLYVQRNSTTNLAPA